MIVGTNNLAIEHDTTELIIPFHLESTAHFNDQYFVLGKNTQNW